MLKLKLCKFDAGCNVSTVDCRLHDTELWTIVIGQEGQHGRSSSDRRVSTDDRHRTGGSARTRADVQQELLSTQDILGDVRVEVVKHN